MYKKAYSRPIVQISEFDSQDIVTASIEMGGNVGNGDIYTPIQWEDEIANAD